MKSSRLPPLFSVEEPGTRLLIRPRSRGRMPSLVGRGSPICERFSRMRLPVIAHVNIILYTGIFYRVYSGTSINCIVKIVMHYMSVYTGIELPRVRHHDEITILWAYSSYKYTIHTTRLNSKYTIHTTRLNSKKSSLLIFFHMKTDKFECGF